MTAIRLFGTHEGRRSPGSDPRTVVVGTDVLRSGEVGQFDGPVSGEEDVVGLQIKVKHVMVVGEVQGVGGGEDDLEHLVGSRLSPATDFLAEASALQVFHDDEEGPHVLLDGVHAHDIGVSQAGDAFGLGEESPDVGFFGAEEEGRGEDLDGPDMQGAKLSGTVDVSHAAAADGGVDTIRTELRTDEGVFLDLVGIEDREGPASARTGDERDATVGALFVSTGGNVAGREATSAPGADQVKLPHSGEDRISRSGSNQVGSDGENPRRLSRMFAGELAEAIEGGVAEESNVAGNSGKLVKSFVQHGGRFRASPARAFQFTDVGKVLKAFQSEMLQEETGGPIEHGAPELVASANDSDEVHIHEVPKNRTDSDSADVLDVRADRGLLVGDDREGFEGGAGESDVGAFSEHFADPGIEVGSGEDLEAAGDLLDGEGTSFAFISGFKVFDDTPDGASVETAIEAVDDLLEGKGRCGGEEQGFDNHGEIGLIEIYPKTGLLGWGGVLRRGIGISREFRRDLLRGEDRL